MEEIPKKFKHRIENKRERQAVFAKGVGCTAVLCGALYKGVGDWYMLCSDVPSDVHGCAWPVSPTLCCTAVACSVYPCSGCFAWPAVHAMHGMQCMLLL